MKWKDTSSYSRGERGTVEPTCWELYTGEMRIRVHRSRSLDGWFLSVPRLQIECAALATSSVEDARAEAIRRVRALLEKMSASLPSSVEKKT